MGQQSQTIVQPWAHPEALSEFIEDLREAGYKIGTDQHIAAQDLVVALTGTRKSLAMPDEFKLMLGPLVCSSETEQVEFSGRFDRWVEQLGWKSEAEEAPSVEPVSEEARLLKTGLEKVDRQKRYLKRIAIGLAAAFLIALLVFVLPELGGSISTETAPEPQQHVLSDSPQLPESFWTVSTIAAFAFSGLVVAWYAYRRFWALFLVRRTVVGEPEVRRIPLENPVSRLFQQVSLFHTAERFRRRIEVPGHQLDVSGTVEESARAGGWLTPVYGTRKIIPEYLVLVDRAAFKDHQSRMINSLIDRLKENEVFVTRYYFDSDPRVCFPESERERPLTLPQLENKYPQHRLILFADAVSLFNPRTGELESWAERFFNWEDRALLTPEPVEQWRDREWILSQQFVIVPASAQGLAMLMQRLHSGKAELSSTGASRPYPQELNKQPRRWLERDPIDGDLLVNTLHELRGYLGEEGYLWFSACAVYPGLDWNLTLYLGNELRTEDDKRILDADLLAKLVRLPWFRHGYMPDWLRRCLVTSLPHPREKQVRSVLQSLLLRKTMSDEKGFCLELANEHKNALATLTGPLLHLLSRKASEGSPLQDKVFTSFLAGGRLAVRVPDEVRHKFESPGGWSKASSPLRNSIASFLNNLLQHMGSAFMKRSKSENTLVLSYLTLRKAIGLLGTLFPIMLALGASIDQTGIQSSLSSYYYTEMRDLFVGTLFAIGFFLFSYRGYDHRDNRAGNLAWISAVGAALFPTAPDNPASGAVPGGGLVHFVFAAVFLLTLAYFSLCLFTKTDPDRAPTSRKLLRNKVYRIAGCIMLACLALIVVFLLLPGRPLEAYNPVFWLEAIAVVVFGVSWLVKGEAILRDEE